MWKIENTINVNNRRHILLPLMSCRLNTDFYDGSRLFADGHASPDRDLQAAGCADAHAQCLAPEGIHVGAVLQRRVVHLNEDVGQDELERQMEYNTVWTNQV